MSQSLVEWREGQTELKDFWQNLVLAAWLAAAFIEVLLWDLELILHLLEHGEEYLELNQGLWIDLGLVSGQRCQLERQTGIHELQRVFHVGLVKLNAIFYQVAQIILDEAIELVFSRLQELNNHLGDGEFEVLRLAGRSFRV